ncbi:hypothetical protein ACVDG3_04625 [Meridianimarinicoccus sp. RP-17]|uniref:hypothetical protein n=1 Tax=Meridianimarinicoccus zhengii TaxID=2056810 RepID=UPI000DAE9967|nr:hypothetical protein [Phycocomes zhengii]
MAQPAMQWRRPKERDHIDRVQHNSALVQRWWKMVIAAQETSRHRKADAPVPDMAVPDHSD